MLGVSVISTLLSNCTRNGRKAILHTMETLFLTEDSTTNYQATPRYNSWVFQAK